MIRATYAANSAGVLSAYRDNAAVIEGAAGRAVLSGSGDAALRRRARAGRHPDEGRDPQSSDRHFAVSRARRPASGGEIRDEGATGIGAKPKAGLAGFSVSNLRIPGFDAAVGADHGKPERIASALEIMLDGADRRRRLQQRVRPPEHLRLFPHLRAAAVGADGGSRCAATTSPS